MYILITKLEVGVIRADVVTSTEHSFHHQCNAHSIEEAKVFGNSILLKKEKDTSEWRSHKTWKPKTLASSIITHHHHQARCPSPLHTTIGILTLLSSHFQLPHPLLTMAKRSLASRALRWRMSRRKTISRKRKPRSTCPTLLRMLLKALKKEERETMTESGNQRDWENERTNQWENWAFVFPTTSLFLRFQGWEITRGHL